MTAAFDRYVDALARLERVTAACDGLILDVRERYEALVRWQHLREDGASLEAIEPVLGEFERGSPPSWRALEDALSTWHAATCEVIECWRSLEDDERTGLVTPAIRSTLDGAD